MDQLFSVGKQILQEQMQQRQEPQHGQQQQYGQQQQSQQQQQQYQQGQGDQYEGRLPPGDKAHGGHYPAGGNFGHDDDFSNAHEEASRYAGNSSNGSDFFSGIVSSITQKKSSLANEDIDEEDALRKHQQVYGNESNHADESSIGTAAAMQALKHFVSGDSGKQQSQSNLLSMAMGEASKLFDKSSSEGRVPSGASKESAIQQAGEMAMKFYMRNQMQSSGGLASIASKFL